MSNVTALPTIVAGGKVAAIVPQSFEDAFRIAKAVFAARMAPKGMESPEACMVAILHGLEVGLTPMAALQRIAVIHGRPTIWGDGAIGLVRASGLCEGIRETTDGTGDAMTATCEAKRRGEPEPIVRTFSVADAKRAQLWGKTGPWSQYPARMLQMRARAFALRDGFADVLGGLYLREEVEDEQPMRDVTPPTPPATSAPALPTPPRPPAPPASHPTYANGPDRFFDFVEKEFATAESIDALAALYDKYVAPEYDHMLPPDQPVCGELYGKHQHRIEAANDGS